MENLIVGFKIGIGGRFNNAGYKTFLGECKISDFTNDLFVKFENESNFKDRFGWDETRDNDQRCILDLLTDEDFDELEEKFGITLEQLGQKVYVDSNQNEVGLSDENYQSGIGTINIDGDFDTVYTKLLSDLDESEIDLVRESDFWNSSQMIDFLESND